MMCLVYNLVQYNLPKPGKYCGLFLYIKHGFASSIPELVIHHLCESNLGQREGGRKVVGTLRYIMLYCNDTRCTSIPMYKIEVQPLQIISI